MFHNHGQGMKLKQLKIILLLIGLHSILLGVFIYFLTEVFYSVFFGSAIDNLFFVRQSGIFLILFGMFYLFPLFELARYHRLLLLVLTSKFVAVLFLIANAANTDIPGMIHWAAIGDGAMALVLAFAYVVCIRKNEFPTDGLG
jgi:hypothetical protein